ncbi:MAG: HAD hydrolase-like protein [Candidatus Marinimicrobia bacterium]|nr:HAD hydrolase-like protein [Candidatus Neomarinimicrobiota bacterium]
MGYKHIIWDWNGTLLDDRQFCIEIMNGVLRRRNMREMTEAWFLENFCFPVKDYYIKLGFDFKKEPFDISGSEFIRDYMARHHEPNLQMETQRALQYFKDCGLTQSLLSAASQIMLDDILQYHDICGYFIKIIGQENHYAYGKEMAGKAWVDELHYGLHEVLFIGDTIHDHEVAKHIGTDCVLVSNGHMSQARLKQTGSPVFDSLNGVVSWCVGQVKT